MIFRVNIGYNSFDIPDDSTAMSFAELAKKYMVNDDRLMSDRGYDVSIDLLDEKEEVSEDE